MTKTVPTVTPATYDLELALARRRTAPYWWPETNTILQLFLSVSIVLMVAFILQQMLSGQTLKIDPSVRDLVVFIMGIVFGNFKDVYNYTFGSSAGQKRQGEAITKSLEDKDKIIASNVDKTAEVAATAAAAGATVAATAAAPAAAKVAAPPAAAEAAPPAVDAALREAGIDPHPVVVVAWWSMLSDRERSDIGIEALADPKVDEWMQAAKVGKAKVEDLDYLVGKNLLSQETADKLKLNQEVKP